MDLRIVPHDPDLMLVPAVRAMMVIVVAPEVEIVEQQTFYLRVIAQLRAPRDDRGMIILMQHLVGLQIEKPLAPAGVLRYVGLMRMLHAAREGIDIPHRVDDLNLIR